MRRLPVLLTVSLVLGAAACGDDEVPVATGDDPTSTSASDEARYEGVVTVLESPDHGPQLCQSVAESYPPQCGGPDVLGWDWDAVDAESANGTTWGMFTVVGTWDGEALTLTEPARVPGPDDPLPPDDDDRFASPCPEPEGGWVVVDPATATQEAMDAAMAYARSQPDVGGVWVDLAADPSSEAEHMDEPSGQVLNVTFTGDLDRHEAAIREVWGGALCVSEASASAVELAEVRAEVESEVESTLGELGWSAVDEVTGRVEVGVMVDDGLQATFDDRYGPGVVEVQAVLQPVED